MERTVTWIAAVIGAVILFALPAAYFQFARAHIEATLSTEVEINARLVSQIVNSNPELWRFQTDRLLVLLQRRPSDGALETRRVLGADGAVIAESADALPAPLLVRAAEVLDSGRVVGQLQIARSLRPALWQTAAAGLAAFVIGALVFIVLRTLPLRALKAALDDLVAQREAARQFERERDAAEAATRVRSEFLARMSHEIRTPMNGVLGMTELLLQTELDAKQRRFAETVMTSGRNLLGIINDILDFSKIDAGKLALERIAFDPAELVEDVTQMLAANAWSKSLQLDCVVERGVPARMLGDPARLRQVLTNLTGNAIKFTERGAVLLRARRVQAAGAVEATLEITVTDSGIGIAAAALKRLFDPFAQADTSTTRRFGGTGLGLAIARQLVEAMGGRLTVESTEGSGSSFCVTLPIAGDVAREPAPGIAPYLRALVIEPADGARESLVAALQRLEIATDVATDLAGAREHLDAARGEAPRHNLVFIEGEVAPAVRGLLDPPADTERRRRVLVLLAPLGVDAHAAARAVGARHVLVKPIRTADVRALVTGAAQPLSLRAAPKRGTANQPHGLRVLLVEDNPVNLMVGKAMLMKLGVELVTASNGRDAIEAAQRASFDLVLMDCQMPVMDGFEATREIRAREAHAPLHAQGPRRLAVVALTANAMSGDRQRCIDAGMDDHLAKPYSIGDLQALLERWAPKAVAT